MFSLVSEKLYIFDIKCLWQQALIQRSNREIISFLISWQIDGLLPSVDALPSFYLKNNILISMHSALMQGSTRNSKSES